MVFVEIFEEVRDKVYSVVFGLIKFGLFYRSDIGVCVLKVLL